MSESHPEPPRSQTAVPAPAATPQPPIAAEAAERAPKVRLGRLQRGGLAPAIMAIVERGVRERPALASGLHVEVELSFREHYPSVRVLLDGKQILVEDGACQDPDLRVEGALPDLISLLVAPTLRGVPTPINSRGRAAIGMLAQRRVRIQGRIGLMRRLLAIIRI